MGRVDLHGRTLYTADGYHVPAKDMVLVHHGHEKGGAAGLHVT